MKTTRIRVICTRHRTQVDRFAAEEALRAAYYPESLLRDLEDDAAKTLRAETCSEDCRFVSSRVEMMLPKARGGE